MTQPPLCRHCRYARGPNSGIPMPPMMWVCGEPDSPRDPVSGRPAYCETQRSADGSCGPGGTLFQPLRLKPSLLQRFVALACQCIWPTEWAMRVLHTHRDQSQWLWRRTE